MAGGGVLVNPPTALLVTAKFPYGHITKKRSEGFIIDESRP